MVIVDNSAKKHPQNPYTSAGKKDVRETTICYDANIVDILIKCPWLLYSYLFPISGSNDILPASLHRS